MRAYAQRYYVAIHGKYRCGTCLREYPIGFEARGQDRHIPRRAHERLVPFHAFGWSHFANTGTAHPEA